MTKKRKVFRKEKRLLSGESSYQQVVVYPEIAIITQKVGKMISNNIEYRGHALGIAIGFLMIRVILASIAEATKIWR